MDEYNLNEIDEKDSYYDESVKAIGCLYGTIFFISMAIVSFALIVAFSIINEFN